MKFYHGGLKTAIDQDAFRVHFTSLDFTSVRSQMETSVSVHSDQNIREKFMFENVLHEHLKHFEVWLSPFDERKKN